MGTDPAVAPVGTPLCQEADEGELHVQVWPPSWQRKEEKEGAVVSSSELVYVTGI